MLGFVPACEGLQCVSVMLSNVTIYHETSGYVPLEGAERLKKQNPALKCIDI